MRTDVSLLLGHGHVHAAHYPLWRLWMEAEIVRDRLHGLMISDAILTQHAVGSLLSKEAAKSFKELVESLSNG